MPSDISTGKLTLKRGKTKPLAMHHPWVFAEAIEKIDGQPAAGDLVEICDPVGRLIGRGYYSPKSKLPVKVFSWAATDVADEAFWRARLGRAVSLRTEFLGLNAPTAGVRLVNAEGDACPGLIVDRYADFLAVAFLTTGMAARAEMFVRILRDLTGARGIYERPEADVARFEGLAREPGLLWGDEPPEYIEITEGRAKFLVDLHRGHKTGFYLDQRENRLRAGELAKGRRVLDAFCYTGGFAIHAALGGAAEVWAVDSSEPSLEIAARSETLNGVTVSFEKANAFERLRMMRREGRQFDMVILDPPKLAKGRVGMDKALAAYKDANLSALRLLTPGGILMTCSCSGLVTQDDFVRALNDAAVDAGRAVRVIEKRGASPDHPFDPACPQTDYLQCLVVRVEE